MPQIESKQFIIITLTMIITAEKLKEMIRQSWNKTNVLTFNRLPIRQQDELILFAATLIKELQKHDK